MLRNLSPFNVVPIRNFALVKNFTPKVIKHRPRLSWEHFTPTNGNFSNNDPLNDGPDWTYVDDNRVTPLTEKQLKEKLRQLKLAERIVQYLGELKQADVEYNRKIEAAKSAEEMKKSRRPKAKGSQRN